jgi:histone-lysine N-methyltransferase SETDB1
MATSEPPRVRSPTHAPTRSPTRSPASCRPIPAGTELCYDYNYMVGSVEGKEIQCRCGAEQCKGRLI